ncbi:hypothetical protein PUNSTDRAFT_76607, partial [Punctularia strigosozonata HHB-11173 SS5]
MGKRKITIGLAQEPYVDFLGNSRANHMWIPVYPTTHKRKPRDTRVYTVVHRSLPQDKWEQIDIETPDVTAIRLTDERGDLIVFNVYIDQQHSDALHLV